MSQLLIRSYRMNVGVLCQAVSLTTPPTPTDSRYTDIRYPISNNLFIKFNPRYDQAVLNAKTLDFATHYLVVKLDYAEGIPKLCSIR